MEERYLYEYDYAKPELTDEFLEHYGVLGMKWGIRKDRYRGISGLIRRHKLKKKRKKALQKAREIRAKKVAEAKENTKTKEQIIADHDQEAMLKNIKLFSTKEIQDFNQRTAAIKLASDNAKALLASKKTKAQKLKEFVISNVKDAAKEKAQEIIKNSTKKLIGSLTDSLLGTGSSEKSEKSNKQNDQKSNKQGNQNSKSDNKSKDNKKDDKKDDSKFSIKDKINDIIEKDRQKSWDRATKANEKTADKIRQKEINSNINDIKKYYSDKKIDESIRELEAEKKFRYYNNKDMSDIDRQIEKLKKKKK